jgi:O-antigen ligase
MQTLYNDAFLQKYNARVPDAYRIGDVYYAPHNLIIDVASRTGVVGLGFFLVIVITFIRMALFIIRQGRDSFIKYWSACLMTAFIAIFIQGLFENTMSGPPAIIQYMIFAMMTILWKLDTMSKGDPVEYPANI